jgi:nucleoside recognition membrane protein YjiH
MKQISVKPKDKGGNFVEDILYENIIPNDIDPNDPADLDRIKLNAKSYQIGLIKTTIISLFAIFIFFWPITANGSVDVPFGYIYKFLLKLSGVYALYAVTALLMVNAVLSVIGIYFAKKGSKLHNYYEHDSKLHPIFYMIGAAFIVLYTLDANLAGFVGPNIVVGPDTGGVVIPAIVLGVAFIIPVGAVCMPLLLNYGGIDFIGALMEPFMRPVFKVPGKSAVDALASFVSSSSMAVIITSRLYHSKVYTKREAAAICTSFSAVSVGFAVLVIQTAGLGDHFLKTYIFALVVAFAVSFIMVRIPPLSRKANEYADGSPQVLDEINEKFHLGLFKRGIDRAAKRAYISKPLINEISSSLADGFLVIPKVLSLLSAVGILGLIIAEYTPFFNYLGLIFIPLLNLLGVPDVAFVAPALPVGIAEMFLPVLMIADKVTIMSIESRFFVTVISMVQIIFFSETIVVMLATRLPVKLLELVVMFTIRTVVAMPIVALGMHLLF